MAKRGRKPLDKKKGYFYEDEEQAIVSYIKANDVKEKNKIYNDTLKPAFDKMIPSIIRRWKFYIPDEEYEQTLNDTLSYLLTKINNFKPSKGKKAYSYCGTVAKNYLIQKVKQYTKQTKRDLPYTEVMEEVNDGFQYTIDNEDTTSQANGLIKDISKEIKFMVSKANENGLTSKEIKVGLALCELLDNWEEVLREEKESNKMKKSSVLYFLREETMMSTKELRDNMKRYKSAYFLLKSSDS